MNKIKAFFIGILLLGITFVMVFLAALVYRANEQSKIKSYIFQLSNFSNQRVGYLQDINDISAIDLRNRLIQKYVSEYFKIIPNDVDITERKVLKDLSSEEAYENWKNTEAKNISKMAKQKMFRTVWVPETGIETLNRPEDYDYYSAINALPIYYKVHYETTTWTESNNMGTQPVDEHYTIYIEARFKPGIKPNIDVRKELESGEEPVGLFMFKVTKIQTQGKLYD